MECAEKVAEADNQAVVQ